MSEQKLTDWFPADVKPVREGIYQTNRFDIQDPVYQNWHGKWWGYLMNSKEGAERNKDEKSQYQDASWRGLASNPNA